MDLVLSNKMLMDQLVNSGNTNKLCDMTVILKAQATTIEALLKDNKDLRERIKSYEQEIENLETNRPKYDMVSNHNDHLNNIDEFQEEIDILGRLDGDQDNNAMFQNPPKMATSVENYDADLFLKKQGSENDEEDDIIDFQKNDDIGVDNHQMYNRGLTDEMIDQNEKNHNQSNNSDIDIDIELDLANDQAKDQAKLDQQKNNVLVIENIYHDQMSGLGNRSYADPSQYYNSSTNSHIHLAKSYSVRPKSNTYKEILDKVVKTEKHVQLPLAISSPKNKVQNQGNLTNQHQNFHQSEHGWKKVTPREQPESIGFMGNNPELTYANSAPYWGDSNTAVHGGANNANFGNSLGPNIKNPDATDTIDADWRFPTPNINFQEVNDDDLYKYIDGGENQNHKSLKKSLGIISGENTKTDLDQQNLINHQKHPSVQKDLPQQSSLARWDHMTQLGNNKMIDKKMGRSYSDIEKTSKQDVKGFDDKNIENIKFIQNAKKNLESKENVKRNLFNRISFDDEQVFRQEMANPQQNFSDQYDKNHNFRWSTFGVNKNGSGYGNEYGYVNNNTSNKSQNRSNDQSYYSDYGRPSKSNQPGVYDIPTALKNFEDLQKKIDEHSKIRNINYIQLEGNRGYANYEEDARSIIADQIQQSKADSYYQTLTPNNHNSKKSYLNKSSKKSFHVKSSKKTISRKSITKTPTKTSNITPSRTPTKNERKSYGHRNGFLRECDLEEMGMNQSEINTYYDNQVLRNKKDLGSHSNASDTNLINNAVNDAINNVIVKEYSNKKRGSKECPTISNIYKHPKTRKSSRNRSSSFRKKPQRKSKPKGVRVKKTSNGNSGQVNCKSAFDFIKDENRHKMDFNKYQKLKDESSRIYENILKGYHKDLIIQTGLPNNFDKNCKNDFITNSKKAKNVDLGGNRKKVSNKSIKKTDSDNTYDPYQANGDNGNRESDYAEYEDEEYYKEDELENKDSDAYTEQYLKLEDAMQSYRSHGSKLDVRAKNYSEGVLKILNKANQKNKVSDIANPPKFYDNSSSSDNGYSGTRQRQFVISRKHEDFGNNPSYVQSLSKNNSVASSLFPNQISSNFCVL